MESRRETCGSVHRTKRDREDGDETAESMADENGGENRWDEEKGIEEGRRRKKKKKKKEMALFTRGEPLVAKLAALAKYVVLPGAMAAAVIYSPPDYASSSNKESKSTK